MHFLVSAFCVSHEWVPSSFSTERGIWCFGEFDITMIDILDIILYFPYTVDVYGILFCPLIRTCIVGPWLCVVWKIRFIVILRRHNPDGIYNFTLLQWMWSKYHTKFLLINCFHYTPPPESLSTRSTTPLILHIKVLINTLFSVIAFLL